MFFCSSLGLVEDLVDVGKLKRMRMKYWEELTVKFGNEKS